MICNTNLTAKEIIYLDYVQGYKVSAANQLDAEKLKRLISSGLLTVGTLKESLQFTDMPKLRDLSKAKSLKANGKKAEIVQRISEKYTDEELERIGIERRLVATQDGKQILDYYDVVVTYHKSFGMKKQLDLCDLMIARNERPRADKEDILISLFLEKLNRTKKVGEKIVLLNMLENVYSWKKDEIKIHEVKKEIQHCQKIWEAEYQQEKAQAEANFSLRFGLSHESMERIKQETEKQLPKPCREESPYILNDQVKQLIHTWNENQRDVEHSILTILETIGSNLKMSKYQLSLTYKELGDMYATHEDYVKAVAAYEIGLALNHNLAVKAMLKKLKKKLPKHTDPITAIPWPKIIEDEKRFSANNYHLPNTYDAD
ncbi:MAG: hypothetical protein LUF91_06270 [Oscillospiraceae bacterium]|nr:hypothetical protein [Oscillospiraceae bacterium]